MAATGDTPSTATAHVLRTVADLSSTITPELGCCVLRAGMPRPACIAAHRSRQLWSTRRPWQFGTWEQSPRSCDGVDVTTQGAPPDVPPDVVTVRASRHAGGTARGHRLTYVRPRRLREGALQT